MFPLCINFKNTFFTEHLQKTASFSLTPKRKNKLKKFPVLCGKSAKGCKEKGVMKYAWEKAAEGLDLIEEVHDYHDGHQF